MNVFKNCSKTSDDFTARDAKKATKLFSLGFIKSYVADEKKVVISMIELENPIPKLAEKIFLFSQF